MQDTTKRTYIELFVFSIALLIAILIIVFTLPKKGDVIVINCSLSEISPDFTNEMREACRQARMKK